MTPIAQDDAIYAGTQFGKQVVGIGVGQRLGQRQARDFNADTG